MHPRVAFAAMTMTIAIVCVADTDANATTCGGPPLAKTVPRPVDARAPRNTRPRVTMHAAWRTKSFCPTWGNDKNCISGRFDVELRIAGNAREAIAATLRESRSGEVATIEIVPKQALAAQTRFEIVYFEVDAREPPRIIGSFSTSDVIDDKPPVWRGVSSHQTTGDWPGYPPRPTPKPQPGKRVITIDMTADCGGPGIVFYGDSSATDEGTKTQDIRYGVWMVEAQNTIDYEAPPLAYIAGYEEQRRPPQSPTLQLSFGDHVEPSEFSFPPNKKEMKIGLRAIDLAGNKSAASEHVVKVY